MEHTDCEKTNRGMERKIFMLEMDYNKKLTLDELYVGMHVRARQLMDIHNVNFVLTDTEGTGFSTIGILRYFGTEHNEEAIKLVDNGALYLYFDEDEYSGEVTYA